MSRFFSNKYSKLKPYTPGEQPRDMKYIKLNTNESPYPPTPAVVEAARAEAEKLQLYSDPECTELINAFAERYGVKREQLIMTNGSDEVLNFAFMAFCDESHPIVFPDLTYGFYPVFAELNRIPYEEIPLCGDFTVRVEDYVGINKNIVIANPNAPTGIALSLSDIEKIVSTNPDNIVIIDEAYVDFGAESAVGLIEKYDNLLVTGTFSKSRSLAGGRLGFGFGSPSLITDLHTIRYSTNPYNVNRMTMAAGRQAILDDSYYMANAKKIMECRENTSKRLSALGFRVLPSSANFLFAESERIDGEQLYLELKRRGILVRHFNKERIKNFNRITVGTPEEMDALIVAITDILKENSK
jgi:histidinol-phosphate aminotransferase